MKRLLALMLALLAPAFAGADYLYDSTPPENKPRVLIIADTSGSMTTEISSGRTRLTALKDALREMVVLYGDAVEIGLEKFSTGYGAGTMAYNNTCGAAVSRTLGSSTADLYTGIDALAVTSSDALSPVAASLLTAKDHIASLLSSDPSKSCRKYYVVLITDGPESCGNSSTTLDSRVQALRALSASGVTKDVKTFMISYDDAANTGNNERNRIARIGGTAWDPTNGWVCWNSTSCAVGSALGLTSETGLRNQLRKVFDKVIEGEYAAGMPVIGSVATKASEIDRVARNFMAYSSYRMPGYTGRLYGIRLYEETAPYSNEWDYTDFTHLDLDNCGYDSTTGKNPYDPLNPCIFDAGRMLTDRAKVGVTERMIFTGNPKATGGVIRENDGLTLAMDGTRVPIVMSSTGNGLSDAWTKYRALDADIVAAFTDLPTSLPSTTDGRSFSSVFALPSLSSTDVTKVTEWLHGVGRGWDLGDLFHSSPTIVEPPPYPYNERGYPVFRKALRHRPQMIYVGANDGMIHAFHAAADLDKLAKNEPVRWVPGEEAWAYLPTNMLAKTVVAALSGKSRFMSQDLACRVDDVQVDGGISTCDGTDPDQDPYCGWRTVLICGQGWGGDWYVALDITEPLVDPARAGSGPKVLWELTTTNFESRLGRTWSLPGVGRINIDGKPTWIAMFGNGYNAQWLDTNNTRRSSYHFLNLDFDGTHPYRGKGIANADGYVWTIDIASGRVIKVLETPELGAITANVPVVDLDHDGIVDAAYPGGWNGLLGRIGLVKNTPPTGSTTTRTNPDNWRVCSTSTEAITVMANSRPITTRPSAFADPYERNKVFIFAGAGIDGGSHPDESNNNGKQWEFRAFYLTDDGSATCPTPSSNSGNLCASTQTGEMWKLNDGQRLLGSPVISLKPDANKWVVYTTWNPPSKTTPCATGEATLWCMNLAPDAVGGYTCSACGDLDGDGTADTNTGIDTGTAKPTSPTTADGQVYIVTDQGPVRQGNNDGSGTGIGGGNGPNGMGPKTVAVTWRETF